MHQSRLPSGESWLIGDYSFFEIPALTANPSIPHTRANNSAFVSILGRNWIFWMKDRQPCVKPRIRQILRRFVDQFLTEKAVSLIALAVLEGEYSPHGYVLLRNTIQVFGKATSLVDQHTSTYYTLPI